jgi:rubrerythrin
MDNSTKPTDTGNNRTGIATSPLDSKKLAQGAQSGSPPARFDLEELSSTRLFYSTSAPPVGTMPPPASIKGAIKAAAKAIQGKHPMVFLDLLGERLAFERTGVRLYDALLTKWDAAQDHTDGPTREEIEEIRDDELAHFGLLKGAIETLGGDPTVMTPSADITAVTSTGIVAVLSDPRTTLNEALKAILVAELADNDAWLTLSDVAERIGQEEMAEQFRVALAAEEEHLLRVRNWVSSAVEVTAGLAPERSVDGDATDGGAVDAELLDPH